MEYVFTDDCLIGVDEIDDEHRELFRLVGEVQALLDEGDMEDKYDEICALIERLKEYAQEHFRHEEAYMESIGHPELDMQRQQHALFCCKVNEADILSAGSNKREMIEDLLSYLVKWLYQHIIGSDLLIGKLVSMEEWKEKEEYDFSEKYLTGIELIDDEHRELFRILHDIHDLIANDRSADKHTKVVDALENLHKYMQGHFRDEEQYMESIGHEGLEVHRLAHDVFSTRLELMHLNAESLADEDELEEFVLFLFEWLDTHILQMDRNLGKRQDGN